MTGSPPPSAPAASEGFWARRRAWFDHLLIRDRVYFILGMIALVALSITLVVWVAGVGKAGAIFSGVLCFSAVSVFIIWIIEVFFLQR